VAVSGGRRRVDARPVVPTGRIWWPSGVVSSTFGPAGAVPLDGDGQRVRADHDAVDPAPPVQPHDPPQLVRLLHRAVLGGRVVEERGEGRVRVQEGRGPSRESHPARAGEPVDGNA
jgi:hypothetical protein